MNFRRRWWHTVAFNRGPMVVRMQIKSLHIFGIDRRQCSFYNWLRDSISTKDFPEGLTMISSAMIAFLFALAQGADARDDASHPW